MRKINELYVKETGVLCNLIIEKVKLNTNKKYVIIGFFEDITLIVDWLSKNTNYELNVDIEIVNGKITDNEYIMVFDGEKEVTITCLYNDILKEYVNYSSDTIFISYDCNSKILKYNQKKDFYIYCYDYIDSITDEYEYLIL